MKSKKFKGKSCAAGATLPQAYYGTETGELDQLKKDLQFRLRNQEELPQLQQAGMQQMSVQPYTPPGIAQQPAQAYNPQEGNRSQNPSGGGRGFTTPGTGSLIAGGLSIANALLPGQQDSNMYHKRQYGTYNPNAYGTGSQAIYDDGGVVKDRFRQEGNIKITEGVPSNLGYGATQTPPPVAPMPAVPPQAIPKAISYERLNTANGRQVLAPKFQGQWTPGEIRNHWNKIPTDIGGREVLRGQAWQDVQGNQAYNPPMNYIPNSSRDTYQEANFRPTYAKMENGGRLSKGQTIELSAEEKAYYESMGYKFK